MRYCEDNRTYAVPNLKIKEVFYVHGDQKRVGGLVGELLDKLFAAFHKRKCRLIGFSSLGIKDPQTGNFSGNLGLLQRREAQLYLKMESPLVNEDWLKISPNPYKTEEYLFANVINDKRVETSDLIANNFSSFQFDLVAGFVGLCFLTLLFKCLLIFVHTKLVHRRKLKFVQTIRRFVKTSLLPTKHRFFSLSLFAVFTSQFLWFSSVLITSNIRTTKSLADQGLLIKSVDDSFKTERTLCYYAEDTEHRIALLSGERNILRRLFEKKCRISKPIKGIEGKHCLFSIHTDVTSVDFLELFFVSNYAHILTLTIFMSSNVANLDLWLSKPFYTMNLHLFHVMENNDWIRENGYLYTESGLWEYFFALLEAKSMPMLKRENRVYQSLEEFQDAFTTFSNLSVENFRSIFLIYVSFCVVWSSLFICKTSANLVRMTVRRTTRTCVRIAVGIANRIMVRIDFKRAVRSLLSRFATVCALFLNNVKSFFRKLFRL